MFDDFQAMGDGDQVKMKKKASSVIKQQADTFGKTAAQKGLAFEQAPEANIADQLLDLQAQSMPMAAPIPAPQAMPM